ncbi:MAG: hypothetical protein BYD32DRAFT_432143 [Podila humilis]|nr:MAG: hypothetical protein BYD32DRAFT_432143 [Podila humilis]
MVTKYFADEYKAAFLAQALNENTVVVVNTIPTIKIIPAKQVSDVIFCSTAKLATSGSRKLKLSRPPTTISPIWSGAILGYIGMVNVQVLVFMELSRVSVPRQRHTDRDVQDESPTLPRVRYFFLEMS